MQLCLYSIHGGLVPGYNGFGTALGAVKGFFLATSSPAPERLNAYPLFIIWHTGFGESVFGSSFSSNQRQSTAHGLLNRSEIHRAMDSERDGDGTSHDQDPLLGSWSRQDFEANINDRESEFREYNLVNALNIWNFMINEAEDTVRLSNEGAAGTQLIEAIAAIHKDNPSFKVVFVGHHAGADFNLRPDRTIRQVRRDASRTGKGRRTDALWGRFPCSRSLLYAV